MKPSPNQVLSSKRNGIKWILSGIERNLLTVSHSNLLSPDDIEAVQTAGLIIKRVLLTWDKHFVKKNFSQNKDK